MLGVLDSPCLLFLLIYAIHKDGYSQSNHSQITRSNNSYSLIQPLLLPCTRACGHPSQPFKFSAPLSRIHIWNQVESLRSRFFAEKVKGLSPLAVLAEGAPSLMSDGILNVMLWYSDSLRRFPPLGLHKGILNYPCHLILLIHTKDKDNKMKILYWPHFLISFYENSSTGQIRLEMYD